ncbi:MAG: signal peptidase II [Acidimicrobiales bacterium]|nr:MAG: signal peptidase II [Acidimicrobiales bacterium]
MSRQWVGRRRWLLRSWQDPVGRCLTRNARTIFAVVALLVIVVDVISKVWVVSQLIGRAPVKLFGGLIYVTHLRNTGAAFNIGDRFTIGLSLMAIIVVISVSVLSRRVISSAWAIALGLLVGGAAGNLIDRLLRAPGPLRGAVVDFISVADPVSPPWPVFNLADSALVVGVVLLLSLELLGRTSAFQPRRVPPADGGHNAE